MEVKRKMKTWSQNEGTAEEGEVECPPRWHVLAFRAQTISSWRQLKVEVSRKVGDVHQHQPKAREKLLSEFEFSLIT